MPDSRIHLVNSQTGDVFPAAPDGSVLFSSVNAGWQGITVEFHRISSFELPEHYIDGHRLAVNIGQPVHYEWKEGRHRRQTTLNPGDFCLQTHGDINFPRWWGNFEFLAIALDPEFVRRAFQDTGALENISFLTRRGAADTTIADFTRHFRAELASGSYCGTLYGESLAVAFALHLIEHHSSRPQKLRKADGKLSSQQLKQIIEYVHEHLSEELSLVGLAEQMNLSAFHFARLFKNSLGLSPHQYLLQNRVERAKKLIAIAGKPDLTDIGLQVGFYDQAHFTKAFKRVVGIPPKSFFKQVAG
ncbi:helix-turn-helix transcriptional regulator [Leptolyngbya sp. FACHB-671]|uniref:helix-turn-helix domain-containing protein n=1 Tax=Leptolyngbya sp. FACHB-671 TaxID=2692812 RepID=UPI001684E18B|nr:AraC family transcriptional regulator [Leptolyngbya sp. FACHB-671]MBD2072107.1 helix-turn-helix transcriptional regulator [Leptolyngbya sp. FACHB-671]